MPAPPNNLPAHHVEVRFGKGICNTDQGIALLAFERLLRQVTKAPVEVFKESMADDSKLRMMMTAEERAKL
jgi:hypothetical protein